MAIIYKERGDSGKAIECYKKAHGIDPTDAETELKLDKLLIESGQLPS